MPTVVARNLTNKELMMELLFVKNESRMMCGCNPRNGGCTCSSRQSYVGANAGLTTSNQQAPLGLPEWSFDELPSEQKAVSVTNQGIGGGIGLPVWDFEPVESSPTQSVENSRTASEESPLGLPVWES